jgi:hypothetical protein
MTLMLFVYVSKRNINKIYYYFRSFFFNILHTKKHIQISKNILSVICKKNKIKKAPQWEVCVLCFNLNLFLLLI